VSISVTGRYKHLVESRSSTSRRTRIKLRRMGRRKTKTGKRK
jgi:hypothetical protein